MKKLGMTFGTTLQKIYLGFGQGEWAGQPLRGRSAK